MDETPGPEASVADSKPQNAAASPKEQDAKRTGLNGHADDASKTELTTDVKQELAAEPTVSGVEANDAPPPESASSLDATKAPEVEVNGNGNGTSADSDHHKSDDAHSEKPGTRELDTKTGSKPQSPVEAPEADEAPAVAMKESAKSDEGGTDSVSENVAARDSSQALDSKLTAPDTHAVDPSEARAVESSAANDVQDTEMTDGHDEKFEASASRPTTDDAVPTSQDEERPPVSELDLGPGGISQLDIGATEPENTSPAEATLDVSMSDAPSVKVAREREDEASDEPSPKRVRTDPNDDEASSAPPEAQAEVIVSGSEVPSFTSSAFDKLSNWSDEETHKRPITAFQRREMRRIISRVKKTKAGGHFRDSVQKLWPALWDSYVAKVERPMDLAELERGLRDMNGPYNSFGDFQKDLRLVFDNALEFNGPVHDITGAAATAVKAVWEEILPIPAEEPAKPKALPKSKPVRESRAAAIADATAAAAAAAAAPAAAAPAATSATAPTATSASTAAARAGPPSSSSSSAAARRQSSGPRAASPAADAAAGKAAPSTQAQTVDRRGSTATEGDRPKRTVRAPKPKDIDYTKPSRKKLKPELQFAEDVLAELTASKHSELNKWFMDPVDAEGLGIPEYYSVIKKPMDLNTVSSMLLNGNIPSLKEFDKTVRLIFDNCFRFNGPVEQGNPVSGLAKEFEEVYTAKMKTKDAWLAKHAKANAPASVSNASDEDDEDEDEEGDNAADDVGDDKEIRELQARLSEEQQKLNSMLLTSNQSMIKIQKDVIDMVQKAIISRAQDVQAARTKAKSDKSRKPGRGGKAKAAASGGRKASAGQAKKTGGSKKPAAKKSLSGVEKDQIANAINDLSSPHLEQAIQIIKRDTGQNENNDGELELDIDQLSNEALVKIWDICKKAIPGFGREVAAPAAAEVSRSAAKQTSRASTAAKPKKNKPMSAQEQEARIAQLRGLHQMYRENDAQEHVETTANIRQAPTPREESSDESDSEEE